MLRLLWKWSQICVVLFQQQDWESVIKLSQQWFDKLRPLLEVALSGAESLTVTPPTLWTLNKDKDKDKDEEFPPLLRIKIDMLNEYYIC